MIGCRYENQITILPFIFVIDKYLDYARHGWRQQFSKNELYWYEHCLKKEPSGHNGIMRHEEKKKKKQPKKSWLDLDRCLDKNYVTEACRHYPYQVGKVTRLKLQDVKDILEANK